MSFTDLFSIGLKKENGGYVNDKIKISNQVTLVMFGIGLFYTFYSLIWFPEIIFLPVLACIFASLVYLLNYYGFHVSSRTFLIVSGILLSAIFHGYTVPAGEPFNSHFFIGQCAILIFPWLLADIREKRLLLSTTAFCVLVLCTQNQFNHFFETDIDPQVFKTPLIVFFAYLISFIIFLSGLYFMQKCNFESEVGYWKLVNEVKQKNKEIIEKQSLIENQNADLQQSRFNLQQRNDELNKKQHELNAQNVELKTAFEKLKQAQAQLVQTEKMASIGFLTAGIAHEINNPVNFISAGIVGLRKTLNHFFILAKEYDKLNKENFDEQYRKLIRLKGSRNFKELIPLILKVANDISVGADRTAEIVKELRNFSRTDGLSLQEADLHQGLESTLLLLKNKYKNIIEIEKSYGDLPLVECFPGKLNQVFMNILMNAIQAIEGEGRIEIITQHLEKEKWSLVVNEHQFLHNSIPGDYVSIKIIDSGKGIPQDVKDKIFEPFFTTKNVGEGTGLGLSISVGIIQNLKGSIQVENLDGKGACFEILLPVKQNEVPV
ncbi:ATP-binding protein [Flexithrix dorotheae]|uniref:ATP-binding protein n=1 Tax=Flexithrix dorotheae TaxID=70993 RepID=UPI00036764D3|nr:ATP-binding protein [Flexithrix dorotheae]